MVAAVGFPTFFIQIYVEFVTNFSDMLVLRISRDFFIIQIDLFWISLPFK